MATDKGSRVLFLVHRKELCKQIKETFELCGVNFDLCEIGMVQTITRKLDKLPKYDLIITDETHHSLSKTYIRIYEYFSEAIRLGFTATPMRMNEGGLGKVYDDLVEGVSTEWLIENNYLSNYKYYGIKLADISNLKTKRGDYDNSQVAELMESHEIYLNTLENWEKLSLNKKTIIYCSSIESSKNTIEEFKIKGYKAEHVDGTTKKEVREKIIEDFRSGDLKVISNVDLFGEGLDVPDCECVILLRPTKSLGLFIQQSMRSMRYKEGKTATIIDHVNNVKEHGLPDMEREWTLSEKKKKKKGEVLVKDCPACFGVCAFNLRVCPYCGEQLAHLKQISQEEQKKDGDLIEIKKEYFKNLAYQDYTKIKTFENMCLFQKSRGYKFGWTIRKAIEQGIDIPRKYAYMARKFYGVNI